MSECPRCNGIGINVRTAGLVCVANVCQCRLPCPVCDGTGFVYDTDEYGYRQAIECSCQSYQRRAKIFADAQIPGRYADAEFSRIRTDAGVEDMVNARRAAWRFAREYHPGVQGILLYGSVGTGKTYLAYVLRYLILNRGVQSVLSSLCTYCRTFEQRLVIEAMQIKHATLVDIPLGHR